MNSLTTILLVLLIANIWLIYMNYQKPLDNKSYLLGTYLYLGLSILIVALFTILFSNMHLENSKNIGWILLGSFIISLFAISFIINGKNLTVNHIAFIIFLITIGLILAATINVASNVPMALLVTAVLVFILTLITYSLSPEGLAKLVSLYPILNTLLMGLIIVLIVGLIFFRNNEIFNKYIGIFIVILFMLFILTDTAVLIIQSQLLTCKTQSCVNYPSASLGLFLDALNIFAGLLH